MTKLFLLYFSSTALFSCGQNNSKTNIDLTVNRDSIAYIKKCVAFIKQVKQKELSDTNFLLADKPFSFEYFDCMDNLLRDTTFYTKDEIELIRNKKYPRL